MTPEREQKMRAVAKRRERDVCVVIEQVDDPHNIGAILRSCDAFGVGEVHLVYEAPARRPRLHEIRGTAMSAAKWLRLTRWDSADALARHLCAQGYTLYPTWLSDSACAPNEADFTRASALIIGNEHDGVSRVWHKHPHVPIRIPMRGFVQSLNVSVATAVLLYEMSRQRAVLL